MYGTVQRGSYFPFGLRTLAQEVARNASYPRRRPTDVL